MSPAVAEPVLQVAEEKPISVPQSSPITASADQKPESLFQVKMGPAASPEEFSYSPVTPLAPITLFFGLCSLTAYFDWYGVAIGGIGTILGVIALWKIRSAAGELSGKGLARTGTMLSALALFAGSGWQTYQYITELPEGYQRVNFAWLAAQAPVVKNSKTEIHPAVKELDGKDIFIKGYMYPQRQLNGLTEFVLLKDTGQCCFGGAPALSDMIVVKFKDFTVEHREMQEVRVAGKFHAGDPAQSSGLSAIYTIDGTHFK